MSYIHTPAAIEDAPQASQVALQNVKKTLGSVPNLFRLIGQSPATLNGFLGFNGALAGGELDAPTRERIALAVAQINGCDYCLAAHSYLAKNVAKLTAAEIAANRNGTSSDAKAKVAVEFAVQLVNARGAATAVDIERVRSAGYSDAQIIEIIGHVAVNTFTNYMNEALGTQIDFPVADDIAA